MKKTGMLFALGVAVLSCGCISVEEIKQEADAGNVEAQYKMAEMLLAGDGIARNPYKAKEYFNMAARAGHFFAACKFAGLVMNNPNGDESENLRKALNIALSMEVPETLWRKHPIITLPALVAWFANIPVAILTLGNCDIAFGSYKTDEYEVQAELLEKFPIEIVAYAQYLDEEKCASPLGWTTFY